MARMVPAVPYPGCGSDGELELYRKLKADPGARHWTVIHSLWLADHVRQQSGEADFIVFVPGKGVLVVEVKACRKLRLEAGEWYYGTSRKPDRRGPFRQASEAMHSIRQRLHRRHPALRKVVLWPAVVFTHCRFDLDSPEWHRWQVIDGPGLHGGSIATKLEHVLNEARRLLVNRDQRWFDPDSFTPTPTEIERIVEFLRPSYEPLETPADRQRTMDRDLRAATAAQLRILDCCNANPRLLVDGPAGTGKTLLAIASAEREVSAAAIEGKQVRVLFICFNRLLREWLAAQLKPLRDSVQVFTMSSLLLHLAGHDRAPANADDTFWRSLPENALARLLDGTGNEWDCVVIDEAQDVLSAEHRDVLDLVLSGGLREGRWRMFGDFERQSIYANPHDVVRARAELLAHAVPLELRDNCRNTPAVARLAETLGGLLPRYWSVLRPDDGRSFELKYFRTPRDQAAILQQSLEALKQGGYGDEEITVVSAVADEAAAASGLDAEWRRKLVPAGSEKAGIRYSTVHRFKGLENRAIILTDVAGVDTDRARDLFYIGVTRTQGPLHVLCHEDMKSTIQRMLLDGLDSGGGETRS